MEGYEFIGGPIDGAVRSLERRPQFFQRYDVGRHRYRFVGDRFIYQGVRRHVDFEDLEDLNRLIESKRREQGL